MADKGFLGRVGFVDGTTIPLFQRLAKSSIIENNDT
jgi:hypothetical protein